MALWRGAGGTVLLATFTFSHGPRDALGATLRRFLAAQAQMRKDRAYRGLRAYYGLQHVIKALEVTWGAANGWHPHTHWLLFVADELEVAELQGALYDCWEAAGGRLGLTMTPERGVDVRATTTAVDDYVTKFGKPPERRPWEAQDELVKAHTKRARPDAGGDPRYGPFDLLRCYNETGETWPVPLFVEYAEAFTGRHQLQWSQGLRRELGMAPGQSDEAIAAAVDYDEVLLAQLTIDQWRAVRYYRRRQWIVLLARQGDAGALRAHVAELHARYVAEVGNLHQPV